MPQESAIVSFMEWVLSRVRKIAGDDLKPDELFDERKTGFSQVLAREIAKIKGVSIFVTCPKLEHVGTAPAGSGLHDVRCLIYIRCNTNLTKARTPQGDLRSFILAERLYTGLDGNKYKCIAGEPPNVHTTDLYTKSEAKGDIVHTFEIVSRISINATPTP